MNKACGVVGRGLRVRVPYRGILLTILIGQSLISLTQLLHVSRTVTRTSLMQSPIFRGAAVPHHPHQPFSSVSWPNSSSLTLSTAAADGRKCPHTQLNELLEKSVTTRSHSCRRSHPARAQLAKQLLHLLALGAPGAFVCVFLSEVKQ